MSKSLAASQKLMQTYLSELLTEEEVDKKSLLVKEKKAEPLEKLLANATLAAPVEQAVDKQITSAKAENKTFNEATVPSPAQTKTVAKQKVDEIVPTPTVKAVVEEVTENKLQTRKSSSGFEKPSPHSYRQGDFQAMFFEVAGLMIAVPLIELGGILNNDKTTALMGKPNWFKGVMLHRDEKVNVVDTARWVMPEKCDDALISALNYQYIVMLGSTPWGLTAEKLVDTVTLKQEDVKWLDEPNKRPWLAGLVKNRMCALLDVDSLIKLLEKGVNITQE